MGINKQWKFMGWLSVIGFFSALNACQPGNGSQSQLASDSYTKKADSVLALMTVEEKIGQLNLYNGTWEFTGPVPANGNSEQQAALIKNGGVGGMLNVLSAASTREAQRMAVENSRLGIPLIFGYDVIHGYSTMFPVPIGQAASWDVVAVERGAAVAAKESAAAGVHWTYSPMIDVSRDGRWGRIMEGSGEDPYLTAEMGKAMIRGYQGDDLSDPATIAACAKHFAAYGFAEAGRDYNTADVSKATLYNVILPPFKAAAAAGAASFMNAFNDVGGVPATGNVWLQRDLLKGEWGYKGFVVSDWGSIHEMVTHGFAQDLKDAASKAITAGSDMDMESHAYESQLKGLLEENSEYMAKIDDAARRILRIKFMLGLFDDPYKYCNEQREAATLLSKENLAVSRDMARKSIVLLKNEEAILPLRKDVGSIAVIGTLAASKDIPLGSWRAKAETGSAVSLLEGIQAAVAPGTEVMYAPGYKFTTGLRTFINELQFEEDNADGFAKAIATAKNADVVVLALGEDCFQTGEGRSQADIGLKGRQSELLEKIVKVNPNVVVVLMNGRPLAIPEVKTQAKAVVETWFLGSEAGHATADVLFGDYNPSGKLPVSFPYHSGQEPLYYSRKNTGRPVTNEYDSGLVFWSHYTDIKNAALWPFGYGLSYSPISYSDLKVNATKAGIAVSVSVTNQGEREAKETVQVYLRDMTAQVVLPIKRLVDFKQVGLKAGETATISFELTDEDLGYYLPDGSFITESGLFQIMVGGNSEEVQQAQIDKSFE